MSWTVWLTTPQMEFKVRDALIDLDVGALVPVEFRWAKRKDADPLKRPLIPGYCFADVQNWSQLQRVDGLRARPVLMIDGRPAAMSAAAVKAVERLSKPLSALRDAGRRVKIGDRLRVKLGHLTDLQADVARITAKGQPVALVTMFGKSHEVTLEPGQWEAA